MLRWTCGGELLDGVWRPTKSISIVALVSPVPSQAPVVVIKKDKKEKHRDETPEERAARKLAKKMKKEAKRAREGSDKPSLSEPLSP